MCGTPSVSPKSDSPITNYRREAARTAATQQVPAARRSYLTVQMDDLISRFMPDLVGRLHGPFAFRFVLQPIMAGLLALHDGLADARQGKPAYFWSVLTHGAERRALLSEGWHRVMRVLVLGVVMDVLYQLIEFRTIHPLQLVVIVLLLAFVPYLVLRGPVNRLAQSRTSTKVHMWDAHAPRRQH